MLILVFHSRLLKSRFFQDFNKLFFFIILETNILMHNLCAYLLAEFFFRHLKQFIHCMNLLMPVQFSSVTQLCLTLCNPMNHNMPGLPVHHQLREFTQTHVHWVSDAIQSSHPLSSPSSPALIFPCIRIFSNESALRIRWPKY